MTPYQATEILSFLASIKEAVQVIAPVVVLILCVLVARLWMD